MRKIIAISIVVWFAVLAVASHASAAPVAYVVDGDTIRLNNGQYVRLIGIDTPEVGECGYQAAKDALSRMTRDGTVRLVNPEWTDDTDRYDRMLRYVHNNKRDLGAVLIRRGLAQARYDSLDGYDPHPRQGKYHKWDILSPDVC